MILPLTLVSVRRQGLQPLTREVEPTALYKPAASPLIPTHPEVVPELDQTLLPLQV